MPVSAATYERVALEDPNGRWELVCGQLRQKPGMSSVHDFTGTLLGAQIGDQVDRTVYEVRIDRARLRVSSGSYRIPDVCVLPLAAVLKRVRETPRELDVHDEAVPFVAEIWSPSTGGYDFDTKLEEYRERGDEEIWYLQPYERTVTIWRRQADGNYAESHHGEGMLMISSLPNVAIDLRRVFP